MFGVGIVEWLGAWAWPSGICRGKFGGPEEGCWKAGEVVWRNQDSDPEEEEQR